MKAGRRNKKGKGWKEEGIKKRKKDRKEEGIQWERRKEKEKKKSLLLALNQSDEFCFSSCL